MDLPSDAAEALADRARLVHGAIAHNAAFVDLMLYAVFHHYVGGKRAVSRATYFTLDSSVGKTTLVKRVAEAQGADTPTLKLIQKLGDEVRYTVAHRNISAHSFVNIEIDWFEGKDKVQVINPKRTGPHEEVTEESLKAQLRESKAHGKKAAQAFQAVCLQLGKRLSITL